MSYQARPTPTYVRDPMDDIQHLALQIEALDVGPDPAAISPSEDHDEPHPDAGAFKVKRKLTRSAKTPPKRGRCTERASALAPRLSLGTEHQSLDKECLTEARQHEESRTRLAALASESPLEPEELGTPPVQPDIKDEGEIIYQTGGLGDSLPAQGSGAAEVDKRDQGRDVGTSQKLTIKLKPRQRRTQDRTRFEVEIVVDEELSTIWDGDFDDVYALGGTLIVRDSRPPSHIFKRDIIQNIEMQLQAISRPQLSTPGALYPQSVAWQTCYEGRRTRARKDPMYVPTLDVERGITIQKEFLFVEPKHPDGPYVWHIRFWAPVPIGLFMSAEHRRFLCHAKVSMQYGSEPAVDVSANSVSVGIEYLRSERLAIPREPFF